MANFHYNSLVWEHEAPRNGKHKARFTYERHEERTHSQRYDRAPTSREAFSLAIAHIEGRLSGDTDKIGSDLIIDYGEFFCQAAQVKEAGTTTIEDDVLVIYEYVTGIKWNEKEYAYEVPNDSQWFKSKVEFNISGLKTGEWNDIDLIEKLHPELMDYLWTERFRTLKKEVRQAADTVLYIPADYKVWPLSRDAGDWNFDIGCYYIKASRGVREK